MVSKGRYVFIAQKLVVCSVCSLVLATRGLLLEHLALAHLDDLTRLAATHSSSHAPIAISVAPQSPRSTAASLHTACSASISTASSNQYSNSSSDILLQSGHLIKASESRHQFDTLDGSSITVGSVTTAIHKSINAAPPSASACTITDAPHLSSVSAINSYDRLRGGDLLRSDDDSKHKQLPPSPSPPLSSPGTPSSYCTPNRTPSSVFSVTHSSGYYTAPSLGPLTPSTSNDTPDPPTPDTPIYPDVEGKLTSGPDQSESSPPKEATQLPGRTSYMKPYKAGQYSYFRLNR